MQAAYSSAYCEGQNAPYCCTRRQSTRGVELGQREVNAQPTLEDNQAPGRCSSLAKPVTRTLAL